MVLLSTNIGQKSIALLLSLFEFELFLEPYIVFEEEQFFCLDNRLCGFA
jgi:hypothetical protein